MKKSKYCCHPPFHPSTFCRHSSKLLSPTLPKLMIWTLLSPPPLSSDPDNLPKFGTCSISKHFKMYITINDIIGEKRIDLPYPIKGKESPEGTCSADTAVVSMLTDNVQYWLQRHLKVQLKSGEEITLSKGVYTDKDLNSLTGTELRVQMINS